MTQRILSGLDTQLQRLYGDATIISDFNQASPGFGIATGGAANQPPLATFYAVTTTYKPSIGYTFQTAVAESDGSVWSRRAWNGVWGIWTTIKASTTSTTTTTQQWDVTAYNAKGNGTTDDTAAINAAKAAAEAAPTTAVFGVATKALYFPPGRYIYNGNIVTASARMILQGDGMATSILYRGSSGTGDMVTLDADYSGISRLGINGGNVSGSGDLLVMSAPYTFAENFRLENGPLNGISIGKGSGAIEARLSGGFIRYVKGYGIQVVSGSGSTDGLWTDLDIGNIGLSGVKIDNGSQNLVNIHVWGCGIMSTTDTHGFWLNSDRNSLANCEAETNRGDGFHLQGKGNGIVGGSSWGNRLAGVYGTTASNTRVVGVGIYRNGVANTTGSTSNAFAGIFNDGSNSWTVSGCNIYDDAAAVPDGTYSGSWTPTNPFIGRTAQNTQSFHYAEGAGSEYTTVTSNTMRAEQSRSGTAVVSVANDAVWAGNNIGAQALPTVTAAATLFPKPYFDMMKITGTATITNVYTTKPGRRITLLFIDAAPGRIASVTGGVGNLILASGADWTPGQYDTLSVISDGTNWYETGRSTPVIASATAPPSPSVNDLWADLS